MRLIISGGGTGGGVYPALAVVEALRVQHPDANLLWVGNDSGPERDMVTREGLPFEGVSGGPVVGVGARALSSGAQIARGVAQAQRIVGRFKPQAILSTGGWPTIPATLACWGRCPIVITMPDVEPGTTIQYLSRIAKRVTVSTEESTRFFAAGQAVVTGYPLRPQLLRAAGFGPLGASQGDSSAARQQGCARFGLDPHLPTVLVMGGSKGARSINEALFAHLPALLPNCQITHISGTLDWNDNQIRFAQITGDLPPDQAGRYHPFEYLHSEDMALALASADLVVARAGASTLGEFPLFGLPAILVPYPHAWRYQKTNADTLAARGAAVRLDDERLRDELDTQVMSLLDDAPARVRMSAASKALAHPDAAARIADVLAGLASGRAERPD